jgi:anti-sigma regulatory factor (Ser/Thr protein kinase)
MSGPAGRAAIRCEGRLENLRPLLEFVDRACARAGLAPDDAFAVRLAVEEVCTNIITHGYRGGAEEPVILTAGRDADRFVVTAEDRAPPFDPAWAPPPDLSADWRSRPIGGVGWHLVRELMDEVHHAPVPGGGNLVTLVKHVPGGSAAGR